MPVRSLPSQGYGKPEDWTRRYHHFPIPSVYLLPEEPPGQTWLYWAGIACWLGPIVIFFLAVLACILLVTFEITIYACRDFRIAIMSGTDSPKAGSEVSRVMDPGAKTPTHSASRPASRSPDGAQPPTKEVTDLASATSSAAEHTPAKSAPSASQMGAVPGMVVTTTVRPGGPEDNGQAKTQAPAICRATWRGLELLNTMDELKLKFWERFGCDRAGWRSLGMAPGRLRSPNLEPQRFFKRFRKFKLRGGHHPQYLMVFREHAFTERRFLQCSMSVGSPPPPICRDLSRLDADCRARPFLRGSRISAGIGEIP